MSCADAARVLCLLRPASRTGTVGRPDFDESSKKSAFPSANKDGDRPPRRGAAWRSLERKGRIFGTPVKFAAKLVLGSVVPGGSAVVELVGLSGWTAFMKPSGTRSSWTRPRCRRCRRPTFQRLEGVLDILSGDLGAAFDGPDGGAGTALPEVARQQLDVALATDDRCRAAAGQARRSGQGLRRAARAELEDPQRAGLLSRDAGGDVAVDAA